MTNGEKIKQIFPNIQTNEDKKGHQFIHFFIEDIVNGQKITLMTALGAREEWWNSEYKENKEE